MSCVTACAKCRPVRRIALTKCSCVKPKKKKILKWPARKPSSRIDLRKLNKINTWITTMKNSKNSPSSLSSTLEPKKKLPRFNKRRNKNKINKKRSTNLINRKNPSKKNLSRNKKNKKRKNRKSFSKMKNDFYITFNSDLNGL